MKLLKSGPVCIFVVSLVFVFSYLSLPNVAPESRAFENSIPADSTEVPPEISGLFSLPEVGFVPTQESPAPPFGEMVAAGDETAEPATDPYAGSAAEPAEVSVEAESTEATGSGRGLGQKIEEVLKKPSYRKAVWGIDIYSVDDDKWLYSRNSDRHFSPASNTKLFTTATALDRLGPDFRFRTSIAYDGVLTDTGVLFGNLVLVGRGDPTLAGEDEATFFSTLDLMAEGIHHAGIRRVEGDIIGDDSYFVYQPQGKGWLATDSNSHYGAGVSALSFNDNLVRLQARPGKAGQAVKVWLEPDNPALRIENHARTVSSKKRTSLAVSWSDDRGTLKVEGTLSTSRKAWSRSIPVEDAAFFSANLFRQRLEKRGIEIAGQAQSRHAGDPLWQPNFHEVYVRYSPPLSDVITSINKHSQNLYAEILLRTLGAELQGTGSDLAGLAVVSDFLTNLGVDKAMLDLYDGSGLSRMNLISPRAETLLLKQMVTRQNFNAFLDSLPVSGQDGTLRYRMRGTPAQARVYAKTGTLNNAVALGGYVRTVSGKTVAFTIFANGARFGIGSARKAVDEICGILAAS